MTWSFLQELSRAVSRFSRGAVAGNHEITVSTFSIQLGQIRLQSPIGSKKAIISIRSGIVTQLDRKSADGDFLQLGPWRSGKQLWIDLEKTPSTSQARKTIFLHFRGRRSYANVLRGTFSTDYKSNCIRTGLRDPTFPAKTKKKHS